MRAGFDELGDVAVAVRSMIDYRSAEVVDIAAEQARVDAAGALVIWDLSHAAGLHPVGLALGRRTARGRVHLQVPERRPGRTGVRVRGERADRTDRQPDPGLVVADTTCSAWGPCTNRGPTSPACSSARRASSPSPVPSAGSRSPPRPASTHIRAKSIELGRFGLLCCDELGLRTTTPRDDARRGGHICVHEPDAKALTKRLVDERNVLADFREPDVVRLGCSPLTTRFTDIARGHDRHRRPAPRRHGVTRYAGR